MPRKQRKTPKRTTSPHAKKRIVNTAIEDDDIDDVFEMDFISMKRRPIIKQEKKVTLSTQSKITCQSKRHQIDVNQTDKVTSNDELNKMGKHVEKSSKMPSNKSSKIEKPVEITIFESDLVILIILFLSIVL